MVEGPRKKMVLIGKILYVKRKDRSLDNFQRVYVLQILISLFKFAGVTSFSFYGCKPETSEGGGPGAYANITALGEWIQDYIKISTGVSSIKSYRDHNQKQTANRLVIEKNCMQEKKVTKYLRSLDM